MNGELTIIIISLIISGFSFGISLLTYWRNRRSEQLKREQDSQMLILASRIVVFWEQLQNIASAKVHKYSFHPYIFDSLRKNATRIEDSLQKAIGLGLWTKIIGDNPQSTILYSTFIQDLLHSASTQGERLDDWTGTHLLTGVIRTIEACELYKNPSVLEITQPVYAKISSYLKENAWTYLTKEAEKRKQSLNKEYNGMDSKL